MGRRIAPTRTPSMGREEAMTIAIHNVVTGRDRSVKREQNHCDEGDLEQHRSLLSNGPWFSTLGSRSWRRNRAVEVIGEQDRGRSERRCAARRSMRRAISMGLFCAVACLAVAEGSAQPGAASATGAAGSSTVGPTTVTSTSSVASPPGVQVEKSGTVKSSVLSKSTSTTTTTTSTTPTTSSITKTAKSTTTSAPLHICDATVGRVSVARHDDRLLSSQHPRRSGQCRLRAN